MRSSRSILYSDIGNCIRPQGNASSSCLHVILSHVCSLFFPIALHLVLIWCEHLTRSNTSLAVIRCPHRVYAIAYKCVIVISRLHNDALKLVVALLVKS